jgi:hypothetical protein
MYHEDIGGIPVFWTISEQVPQNFAKWRQVIFFLFWLSHLREWAMEHDLFLCPFATHLGSDLLAQTWVHSLFSFFSPLCWVLSLGYGVCQGFIILRINDETSIIGNVD